MINKDIRELNPDDIKNIDFVVHMAELSNDPLGELSDGLTEEINHVATKNLLEICNLASVKKFIYMSSCAVYGKNDNLVNELSELSPLTNYSKSKVANERYIKANEFNFEIIISDPLGKLAPIPLGTKLVPPLKVVSKLDSVVGKSSDPVVPKI